MNQQTISAIEKIIVKYQDVAPLSEHPLCYFLTLYLHNKGTDVERTMSESLPFVDSMRA